MYVQLTGFVIQSFPVNERVAAQDNTFILKLKESMMLSISDGILKQ
ncbi:hypothetical protein GCM10010912_53310 [Paenibacillus albidus]|uniref:Uncharacterized protein n=2 Tax=Paenibacillus albidus TaxID=2041023 RepID=A0A917CY49_9BACL|nr:hypothetical protein GCM10010912_53310 [Paenibacillus albidus]